MNTAAVVEILTTLATELVDGAPVRSAYVLNPGDAGLLRSLDRLSAAEASVVPPGGASAAAHVDHLRYALSLMNRWSAGEKDPFRSADWAASWQYTRISETEWAWLLAELRGEAHRWRTALAALRTVDATELTGMVASVVHLAYHLGAVRQIARGAAGPAAAPPGS